MKKITLLILMCWITHPLLAQFPESFNNGTSNAPEGWVTFIGDNGIGTEKNWTFSNTGEYAFVEPENIAPDTSEDWLVTPQFMVDGDSYMLSFLQMDLYPEDNGSVYTVRVSTTDQTTISNFETIATYYETDLESAVFNPFYIDLSSYAGQNIYVAFVMEQQNGDYWYIDDVNVTGNMTIPNVAENPSPYDTELNVVINNPQTISSVDLSWTVATTGDPASYYKIYFGDDPSSLTYIDTVTDTFYTVPDCLDNHTYYWSIVPTNVAGDAVGSATWSFTTGSGALAIEDFDNPNFQIYPTPADDFLHIKTDQIIDSIHIVNQAGKRVIALSNTEINNNTINISELDEGIYYLTIISREEVSSYKVIKG